MTDNLPFAIHQEEPEPRHSSPDPALPEVSRGKVGLALLSPQLEVLFLNAQMQTWFPVINLRSQNICYQVFHNPPGKTPCQNCPVQAAMQDGEVHAVITDTSLSSEGSLYQIVASPVTDEQGRVTAVFEIVEQLSPETAHALADPSQAGGNKAVRDDSVDLQAANRALLQELKERERVDAEILDSERRYRLLAENATDVIWTMDLGLRSTYVSPSVTHLLGYSVAEAMRLQLKDYLTPADLERALCEFRRVMAAYHGDPANWLEYVLRMEFDLIHKDGHSVPVETVFSFLISPDGRAEGILSHVRGIAERRAADLALRTSQESIRALLDAIQESAVLLDPQGRVIAANATIASRLGANPETLTGVNIYDHIHPRDVAESRRAMMDKAFRSRQVVRFEDTRNGRVIDNTIYPVLNERGDATRAAVLGVDITEQRRAMEALRQSEQRYRLLTENANDIIWTMDMQLKITSANPAITHLLGYSVEETLQMTLAELLTPESLALALNTYAQETTPEALERWVSHPGASLTLDLEYRGKNGRSMWMEVKVSILFDEHNRPTHIHGISRDIEERRRASEKLHYLATHDSLTGLPTRQVLMDRLEHAIERAVRSDRSGAVMLLDMDNFKTINDTLGHAVGDRVLKAAAGRMSACLRRMDTVARTGGDEFTFVLENVENEAFCQQVAGRILEALAAPLELEGEPASLTASIGICVFPAQGQRADDLLHKADIAMYLAKRQRNTSRVYKP